VRSATDQDVATQIAGLAEIDQPGIGFTEAPRMGWPDEPKVPRI
jgi:hypothetical protein